MSFTAYIAHKTECGKESINGHRMSVDCGAGHDKLAKRFISRDGAFIAEVVDDELVAIYAYMGNIKVIESPIYDKRTDLAWQSLIELACQKSGILLDL